MKRIWVVFAAIAAIAAIAGLAHAGLDMYTSKTYKTLLAPSSIGVIGTGGVTNMVTLDGTTTNSMLVITTKSAVTNSATDGVDCVGLPGVASLVLSLNPGVGGGGSITMTVSTCSTTNGTYITLTNAAGVSSWSTTGGTNKYVVSPLVPNAYSRYWRVTATATGVTNGNVGAVLVTE